jgi:tetratricopeptide (TPR) repeat protein
MNAARTYARRGPASPEFRAWLDAVEAECETISGHTAEALRLINHAEHVLAGEVEESSPQWFNWFSPVRLAAFKGNTQLKAGKPAQAKATLIAVLEALGPEEGKQRSVILGDLAAVEVAQGNYHEACHYAQQALDQLSTTWYATGMDRVNQVRRTLQPWSDTDSVRALDDRLYGWQTTLNTLRR